MRRSLLLPPLTVAAALLAGCGNKGPLVLPPPRPAAATHAPAPAPAAPAPASSTVPATHQH